MDDNGDLPRRLETPERGSSKRLENMRRSRSRMRSGTSVHRHRSRSRLRGRSTTRERERLRDCERNLDRDRKRLQELEEEVRRKRSRLRSTERHERDYYRSPSRRASQHRDKDRDSCTEEQRQQLATNNSGATTQRSKRSDSASFSTNDIVKILNTLKETSAQPSTSGAPIHTSSVNHKNILPDFDPSSKNQRIDIWLKKVNECATVYGWDDKTTIHFAMQKLKGLAKVWYEGLNSILFTWTEWQEKLLKAFPYEQNYGQSLEVMLNRKSSYNEPIEVYHYDKLALLNQCDIDGKRAVDCLIHGLSDKTLKSSALALRCSHPDQLLQFLISNKETTNFLDRSYFRNKTSFNFNTNNVSNKTEGRVNNPQSDSVFCFNCKEVGHPFLRCPKPLVRCSQCYRVGHKAENCTTRVDGQNKDSAV